MRRVHFTEEEFAARRVAMAAEMEARGLDAMLLFAPESQYWLSGFDTFGYCFFQCLVAPRDGPMAILTRSADSRQAAQTSIVEDIRVWRDRAGAAPAEDLKALLQDLGLKGARLGVETDTHGLTAAAGRALEIALAGFAELVDASDLVSSLRLVKSPAEIAYVRQAAVIGDAAYAAVRPMIKPGADEGEMLAAMQGAVLAAGGDYPGNPFIFGSAEGALLCRSYTGRRRLSDEDQLTLEWAGVYRHYHAALMRTTPVGRARPEHERMFDAARAALLACEAALVPGQPMHVAYDAHAATLDAHGLGHARLNACGYALGARFPPSWMEAQMFYEGAPTVVGPGMVFFLHMILMDSESGCAMSLGRTSLVGETGAEPLSTLPLELDVAT